MIRDRLIVCIASSWDYDPTCKHHLMRILSRHNDILWINYHGSRRPEVSHADLRDAFNALRRVARGLDRVSDSIIQMTPFVIPGATNPMAQWAHQRLLIAQIRRAIRAVRGSTAKPVQVWTFAPDVPFLTGAFDEECFVYYCTDDYRRFDNFNAAHIARAEDELLQRADLVITTSQELFESQRRHRPDAVLVRHGVDFEHFAGAWRSPPQRPNDLAEIPRPRFGFFGLIHHWVDVELITRIARLRPSYSFVLIGDCKVDVSSLRSLGNVHLLGRRSYAQLPAYCAAFDAAMLLFRDNAMTRSVNPVKMYEYLAAGLPVVSLPLPEAQRFGDAIRIVDTPEQFAGACDQLLAAGPPDRQAISRLVEKETWLSKTEQISDMIQARLPPVSRTLCKPAGDVDLRQRVTFDAFAMIR